MVEDLAPVPSPPRRNSYGDSPGRVKELRRRAQRERKRSPSKEINEMVNYIIFLILFLIATFQGRNDNAFATRRMYLAQLRDRPLLPSHASAFRSFQSIVSIREFYDYLIGPFYDSIYGAKSFDGETEFVTGEHYNAPGFFAGYGRIIGTIRIGQLRVSPKPCEGNIAKMPTYFSSNLVCYPELSSETESVAPFGYGNETYFYPQRSMPSEPYFAARSTRVYGSPRFTVSIPSSESLETCNPLTKDGCIVYSQLASLRDHKFIDLATRAIFIDFTTYNPNSDEQTVVRLMVEMTKGGGFTPQVECMSYRLYRNTTSSDAIRLAIEILVLLQVVIQLRQEFQLIRRMKWAYLNMIANVAHLFSLIIFGPITALRVLCAVSLPSLSTVADQEFPDFRTPVWYATMGDAVTSFTFFLSWLKLFKFLGFLPLFAPLTKTVGKSSKKVAGLILIFGVAMMGSALSFTMAFGLDAENYKTFADSCLGLLKILQGELEFEELHTSNRVLGPLFFVIFVTLMFFVILNMFIVVISDAYVETKGELKLMHALQLDTLSKQVVNNLLYNIIFKIPGCGHQLQKRYECTLETFNSIASQHTIDDCHAVHHKSANLHTMAMHRLDSLEKIKSSNDVTQCYQGLSIYNHQLLEFRARMDSLKGQH